MPELLRRTLVIVQFNLSQRHKKRPEKGNTLRQRELNVHKLEKYNLTKNLFV